MVVLLFYFQLPAAGGKDDSPWRRSLGLFTHLKQLLIDDF